MSIDYDTIIKTLILPQIHLRFNVLQIKFHLRFGVVDMVLKFMQTWKRLRTSSRRRNGLVLAIRGQCQQCQDCTASTAQVPGWTSRPVEQKTGLETELQIIASKTRLIRIGMQDRCWRGLADHCAVGSRASLNCNISLSIYAHTEKD